MNKLMEVDRFRSRQVPEDKVCAEAPHLSVEVSRVRVQINVVLGLKYLLESSIDLKAWTPVGDPFVAQQEQIVEEFDVIATGRYFRITQVP